MEKNFENISLKDAQKLANSPAGRRLMELLQQGGDQQLNEATEKFIAGDAAQAQKLLKPLLESPEIAALLKQLGG